MKLKKALLRNLMASGWGKMSTVVFRLIQIPILLSLLGLEDYGRWLVLYSFPSWIALANLGFGSVASNEMSMEAARNNIDKAKNVFSTTLGLIISIFTGGMILAVCFAPVIPWENILKSSATRHKELSFAVIWLAAATLLSFFGELFEARFRAARKAHLPILLYSFRPWLELAGMMMVLQFSKRFDYLSLSILCTTTLYIVVTRWLSYRAMPALSFSFAHLQKKQLRTLFKKGIAFQAFPLGNALIYQGNILVVQLLLGPVAVAIFGSVRTLVRSINQMLELVNQVMWPELSLLFGSGDMARAARLHRIGVVVSIGLACFCVLGLAIFGQSLFSLWTGKAIVLSQFLLLLFLLPIPFNALWFTSSVIHMASNRHEGLAVRYLIAMLLAVTGCGILSHFYGIEGAAVSTLIADLFLIPYVFKRSLQLTNDTPENFMNGLKEEIQLFPKLMKKFIKTSS